jgi:predicted dehydrogenase
MRYTQAMHSPPLRAAIIGLGGFAASHHRSFRDLENTGACRVVATCDLQPHNFDAQMTELAFAERGLRVYADYIEMLDRHRHELDLVVVPTPIPLHAPMHRACVERGLACYLEKPPTLDWRELDAMLAVETGAPRATNVGFIHIVEPSRRRLKQRLVDGEFGALQRVGFSGHWPRDTAYFQRAAWAGKLIMDDRLVLDSCVGNALSHFVHDLLYWCGTADLWQWQYPATMEAELYRAHTIQGFDTCFARGHCENEVEFRVGITHAAQSTEFNRELIECENAVISYQCGATLRINVRWRDGRQENYEEPAQATLTANIEDYFAYLRGNTTRPSSRLIDTAPFVCFNDLVYIAAGRINTVNQRYLLRGAPNAQGATTVAINDIVEALDDLAGRGMLPSEAGRPWAGPGGRAKRDDLKNLHEVVYAMCQTA